MKKILSLALAVMMLVSVVPMVYAADVDYTNGTAVEYTATGTESYTVTVPASLAPGAEGTVTLAGTWASDRKVTVTADSNVVLTNSINTADQKTLAITFAGIEQAGDNTESKTYTEAVSVAAMPADALFGTWSGKFNYSVEIDDVVQLITFTIGGGTYQAEEGMTWREWYSSDYCPCFPGTPQKLYGQSVVNMGNANPVQYNGVRVSDNDTIIDGAIYNEVNSEI